MFVSVNNVERILKYDSHLRQVLLLRLKVVVSPDNAETILKHDSHLHQILLLKFNRLAYLFASVHL